MFKKQVCPIHLKHVSSSKMVLRECSTSEDKGQCWGHGGRPLVVFCSTDWDAHYSIAMEQMSALLFQIDTETSQISWKTETSLTSQWLNWFKLYQTHIFNCPEQLNRWTCHSLIHIVEKHNDRAFWETCDPLIAKLARLAPEPLSVVTLQPIPPISWVHK